MRLVLIALSSWTIVVVGLLIAGAFLSIDNKDSFFSAPATTGEAVIATLFIIPTLLLGFLVLVGLRPVEEG